MPKKGEQMSAEWRAKISASNKAFECVRAHLLRLAYRPRTERQLAALRRGCRVGRNPGVRQPHSEATRKLIGAKSRARWANKSTEEKTALMSAPHRAAHVVEVRRKAGAKSRHKIKASWAKLSPEQRARRTKPGRLASSAANPSSLEMMVGVLLEKLGIDFIPQHQVGRYIVDFVVPSRMLVIECDGSYWHSLPGRAENDATRDEYLRRHGYEVFRLSEAEIKRGQAGARLALVVGGTVGL